MARKKTTVTDETEAIVTSADVTDDNVIAENTEPTFKISVLQKHCRKLFGVSTATFVGATAGITDKNYSVNEIKGIIEAWCKKEVK